MSDDVRTAIPDTNAGKLPSRGVSPTAATVGNPLYGASGVMSYRVTMMTPGGLTNIDVEAATGDDAANAGLAKFPGGKVAKVDVTPQKAA